MYKRQEDTQIREQLTKLDSGKKEDKVSSHQIPPVKPQVSFEDFEALDLQVAEIIRAKKVNKTKKLIEIKLQLKKEVRTIVSGIAVDFKPDDLIGKNVTLLSNLAPRELKGVESNGMILLGKNEYGNFIFVSPEEKNVQNGSPIT